MSDQATADPSTSTLDPSRVFVSSTCYDLVDVRAELKVHLQSLGLTPVMSDQIDSEFETSAEHSIEICLQNVRTCPTFVCLLSQRYGPTLEKYGYAGLSATHVEYRTALTVPNCRILFYARDRLQAEYSAWKKNPDLEPTWTKGKQLFDFLDERVTNHAGQNWCWPFAASVDLKQRLTFDLKRESAVALFDKLMLTGRLPVAHLERGSTSSSGGGVMSVHVVVINMGETAMIRPKIFREGRRVDAFPLVKPLDQNQRPVGELPLNQKLSGEISVRYSTVFGHEIEDTFAYEGRADHLIYQPKRRRLVLPEEGTSDASGTP